VAAVTTALCHLNVHCDTVFQAQYLDPVQCPTLFQIKPPLHERVLLYPIRIWV